MSTNAAAIVSQFRTLGREDQLEVYEAIARSVVPEEYGPLTDDDLTAIAAQTFALMDEEEDRAKPR
jgi:hypothetical protein